jgi:hypothetical protein
MLHYTYPSLFSGGKRLNGLIYVHRISDPKVGGISKRNLRLFKQLCGDGSLRNVCIATTNWGRVTKEEGDTRELELRESPNIFKPLIDEGAQLTRQDNGITSARSIVDFLIHKDPTKLQIQIELDAGLPLEDTSTGAGLREEILALKAKQKAELQALREEMEEAARENHAEILAELEEERQKREAERKKMEEDLENLKMQARSDQMKHDEEIRRLEAKTAMDLKHLEAKLLAEREAREELERKNHERFELQKHEEEIRRSEDKRAMNVKQMEAKLLAEREAREESERNNRERLEFLKPHEEKIRLLEDKVAMDAKQIEEKLSVERKAREELEGNNRKLRELVEQQAQRDKDKHNADLLEKKTDSEAKTKAPAKQERERLSQEQVKRDKGKQDTKSTTRAEKEEREPLEDEQVKRDEEKEAGWYYWIALSGIFLFAALL